ncbi:hypothetical protein BSL78_17877 [Apostichopus japonicus]|uniref:Uncharacterized protein n=1 Tax=Stichopus japonicus TaxID=307972 RepID=A0A2G8KB77_STIJA|nr:hypothetical protein BSL78_17877 [Apostichopus japonicus]
MVLAEWHAAQDAACTGSPVATPAIGDTSRAPSQPAQETLSGPDSDSPMEDCTTALLVVAKESSDWFDETKQATDLIDSSGPSTLPAAASAIPDTMVASGPPVPDREVHSIKVDEELRTLLPRKKRGNTVRGLKRPVLGKFRRPGYCRKDQRRSCLLDSLHKRPPEQTRERLRDIAEEEGEEEEDIDPSSEHDTSQDSFSNYDIFDHLLGNELSSNISPHDMVRIVITSEQLDTPIALPFIRRRDVTVEKIMAEIQKVYSPIGNYI